MPRLTDSEKQEILRHLEADKPLPDKYRFLLFEDKREVELVWNGKSGDVCNVVLPFQTIEQVDEPRKGTGADYANSLLTLDARGRQDRGWTNKLIWGDNRLILSTLKNGPMREEIERQGGLRLIYIDPPFDVGADFSMDIEIGEETFTKEPNILEEIAYRDTWGKGADSFISMIYERLQLMRDLLAEDGSIYVHCDWRVSAYLRNIMDEIFGKNLFLNEIIWSYRTTLKVPKDHYGRDHDSILFFKKNKDPIFHPDRNDFPASEATKKRWAQYADENGFVSNLHFAGSRTTIIDTSDETKGFNINWGIPRDVWDISTIIGGKSENLNYPTQKPEALLERIIKASSHEGDLVADFFCGSGTLPAVAERLGRKWIATDLGKFAIHTTRKRLLGVQRKLKVEGRPYRAFEVLNLGRYERQHYAGLNQNLREEERRLQQAQREAAFTDLILKAWKAERVDGYPAFHGRKQGRMVVVGPVNMPVSRRFVEEIILECRKHRITRVDLLGFEFEMGLFPDYLDEARQKGVDIVPRYIPAEVFDRRAVDRGEVVFHDVAFIEARPLQRRQGKKREVAVELTDFSVFYSQGSREEAEAALKPGKSRIIADSGHVYKISKDRKGKLTSVQLTKKWTDWIDYWAVDYDFESRREIVSVKDPVSGETVEQWTGDYIFENEWQSFRTRQNRKLELVSAFKEVPPGEYKLAVKVVDIFGNDTMTIVPIRVGGKN